MVDLARAQTHHSLVDDTQQLHPPSSEQTVNLILVAYVVVVCCGEYLALAYGAALNGILRESCSDRLQALGKRLTCVLHTDVGRCEATTPRRTLRYGATTLCAVLDDVEQGDDDNQQHCSK